MKKGAMHSCNIKLTNPIKLEPTYHIYLEVHFLSLEKGNDHMASSKNDQLTLQGQQSEQILESK
jgi:hypothetical protein